jgi:hypothetical protein
MNRMVKRFVSIIILSTLYVISGCSKQKTKWEGIYQLAYVSNDNEIQLFSSKLLLDFSSDSLSTVWIGDVSTGMLDKIQVEKSIIASSTRENEVNLHGEKFRLTSFQGDSVALRSVNDVKTYAVLKKWKEEWKWKGSLNECFAGAYSVNSGFYQDSICFVNPSVMIYTGDNQLNFPVVRWNVIQYQGFRILNIQDEFVPLMVIQSCTEHNAILGARTIRDQRIEMKAVRGDRTKSLFLGKWIQFRQNNSVPPSVDRNGNEILIELNVDTDSLVWQRGSALWKRKWDMTEDGNRIYFIDHLFNENGSWKIYYLNDQKMVVRLTEFNGFMERFIYFAKVN